MVLKDFLSQELDTFENILKNRLFDQTWGGLESVTLVGYWLVILHPHPNYPQKRTGFSNIADRKSVV